MRKAWLLFFAFGVGTGLAADNPEFEVASVKPSVPSADGRIRIMNRGGPGTSDPGQVTYSSITLKNLLTTAYGVKPYQVSGPGWLDTERYDVTAKIPADTGKEQFGLMLQNLIAERFKLTLHHETKDQPLYELVVAKGGPRLKPYVADPNALPPAPSDVPGPPPMGKDGRPMVRPGGEMIMIMNGRLVLKGSKQSSARLADVLANQLGRPVVDKTGLTGEYDYSLEFSREGLSFGPFGAPLPPPPPLDGAAPAAAAGDQEPPSLLTAVQEQLGLKLESKKAPLDLLVIDRAEKTPVEN